MKIVLVGGSGFVGQRLVRAFAADGHESIVLTRQEVRRRDFRLCRNTTLVEVDVHDPEVLASRFNGADAVVSMAGILNPSGRAGFEEVHVELVMKIVDACAAAGVGRLLHVSALNAGKGESKYLDSKGRAEQVVSAAPGMDTTIFQPSVIFGPGDSFFNRFATLLRWFPVMPLACAESRLQPIYVGDVAHAVCASLRDPGTHGRTFELGGPSTYTLAELVRFTARVMGLRRAVIPQPDPLSVVQGAVMGLLPNSPFSLDNFRSLKTGNVCSNNGLSYFDLAPTSVETSVPDYLATSVRQRKLDSIRSRARR